MPEINLPETTVPVPAPPILAVLAPLRSGWKVLIFYTLIVICSALLPSTFGQIDLHAQPQSTTLLAWLCYGSPREDRPTADGDYLILSTVQFTPMPLNRSREPFSSPDWIFELKYDGFRALAEIEYGRCRLISRNGNAFATFQELALGIGELFPRNRVVLDGEIVCLDESGRPQFTSLLFRRGPPSFIAFDLLYEMGTDLRREQALDRKAELRRLLNRVRKNAPLMYADHIEEHGPGLFQKACELDLEGIVAKLKSGPYVSEREHSTWRKILNPKYSQKAGREDLFERERRKEPVPGWHSCAVACAELEEA